MMPVIVSGGQTGVDRGALDAALDEGAECGGWCPADRLAEDGSISPRYPLRELPGAGYAERTLKNVQDSDATLIICYGRPEGGTALTLAHCRDQRRPYLLIDAARDDVAAAVEALCEFVHVRRCRRLNVAGPRASRQAGAGDYAYSVVRGALRRLRNQLTAP